ncbi:MAG: serine hydrolase domain-containing protein [Dehalococcoidia bacterium]
MTLPGPTTTCCGGPCAISRSNGRPARGTTTASAHWTAAVLIEAVTGRDFREVIRSNLLEPLGLRDTFVGAPAEVHGRCADMHVAVDGAFLPREENCSAAFREAGVPGGGGYATAADMAAFYQMLCGRRPARPPGARPARNPVRNPQSHRRPGGRQQGMPMHRGLGPHVRGTTPTIRGLGTIGAGHLRPRRRGQLLFMGRPAVGRVVHLPDERTLGRTLAPRAAGPDQQPGARGGRRAVATRAATLGGGRPTTARPTSSPWTGHTSSLTVHAGQRGEQWSGAVDLDGTERRLEQGDVCRLSGDAFGGEIRVIITEPRGRRRYAFVGMVTPDPWERLGPPPA